MSFKGLTPVTIPKLFMNYKHNCALKVDLTNNKDLFHSIKS